MLGKLFGFNKEKPQNQTKSLNHSIRESILNVVGQKSIPPMPGAAQKAFKLSTDPNAEARDFIDVIESDEALSARIIKIANSVYFDRGKQSKSIEDSVIVIGINELRCLLSSTSLSEIFPSNNFLRHSLWAHDVACALISKSLASRICPQHSDLAFLCGLMHDIGKLLLVQRAPEDYAKVIKYIEEDGRDFSKAEEQVFVFTHTEVGQLIGEKWNFSSELLEVIANHHHDWPVIISNTKNPQLTMIIKAASIFAHALGLGHPKNFSRLKNKSLEYVHDAFQSLSIPENEEKTLLSNFARNFETEYDLYSGKTNK